MLFFFVLTATYFLINLRFLMSYAEPSGADGYFYLKQILSLTRDGVFYFPDKSLAFLLPVGINFFIGRELLAYQISIALVNFLYQWAVLAVATSQISWHKTKRRWIPWVTVIFLVTAFNFGFYELSFVYFKTAVALVFFLVGVAWDLRLSQKKVPLWRRLSNLLFVMSLLSHKTALPLLALYYVSQVNGTRRSLAVVGGVVAAGLLGFVLFYAKAFHYLSFLVSFDLNSLSVFGSWLSWLWSKKYWHLAVGPLWTVLAFVGVWVSPSTGLKRLSVFLAFVGLFAWLPFLPHNLDAPTYRMSLIFAALMSTLFVPLAISQIKPASWLWVACGLVNLASFAQFKWGPSLHGFYKNYSAMDPQVKSLENFVKPDDHLTCHHGLEFYVDYHTRIRCRSFLADDPEQNAWRVVWAPLQRGPWARARVELNQKSPLRLGKDYFLMTEKEWNQIRETYGLRLTWKNPMKHRPAHIQK